MIHRIPWLLMAFSLAFTYALPLDALAQQRGTTGKASPKLYRWVDAQGKVHYTDTLPDEAVQQGRTEYAQGRVVNQIERPPTAEELAAQAKAQAQTQAQTAAAAQVLEQRAILVQTYPSEADLVSDYERRKAVIDGRRVAALAMQSEHRKTLMDLLERAAAQEIEGKPVPKKLADSIVATHQAGAGQRASIQAAEADLAALEQQQAQSLEQWRIAKGLLPDPASAPDQDAALESIEAAADATDTATPEA